MRSRDALQQGEGFDEVRAELDGFDEEGPKMKTRRSALDRFRSSQKHFEAEIVLCKVRTIHEFNFKGICHVLVLK